MTALRAYDGACGTYEGDCGAYETAPSRAGFHRRVAPS
jgi:hypothetical protein